MPPELNGYRILKQIGVGGSSTISQVVRVTTGQFFALKRVVRRDSQDVKFLRQTETEYEVGSRIEHPNLRKILSIQRHKTWFKVNELLLLMEYVVGSTLEQSRPTDLDDTIAIFREIAQGLDAMHQAGYLHADMKPNNIMLTGDQSVKIIDFGQSCRIGHKKERIQGTPDYIAPEQVRRLPLDHRTDVFNFGATLYWVLTNKTFPTDIRHDARPGSHEIVGPKRAPKDLVPALPAALSTLVMDCCASSPEKRPSDMNRVIARLDVVEERLKKQTSSNRNETKEPQSSHDDHA